MELWQQTSSFMNEHYKNVIKHALNNQYYIKSCPRGSQKDNTARWHTQKKYKHQVMEKVQQN